MKRNRDAPPEGDAEPAADPICALCERPIPPDAPRAEHQFAPRQKGGRGGPKAPMHQICRNEVHAALSEADLARRYPTPEALRAHPALAKFIAWVAGKDPGFDAPSLAGPRRRRPR